MGKRNGGYDGSSDILTSTSNQELVSKKLFSEFYFYNDTACHVKVNGGNPIYLRAGQNFEIDESNPMINSFIVVDSGVSFSWLGIFE